QACCGAPCGGAPWGSWVLIACPLLYLSAAVCEVRRGCEAADRRRAGTIAPGSAPACHAARVLGLAHPGRATTRRRGVAALIALWRGACGLDADRHRVDPPPAPELATPESESVGGAPDGGALVLPRLAEVPSMTTVVDPTDPVALA